ncbi:MAG: single-stranded-DNA-specific exonuclease RecJ [Dehalococcoidales bacterium]|nr:single-stranded-DNA-specific exonuclease RecJ [Dehalococcoidales bacterium]
MHSRWNVLPSVPDGHGLVNSGLPRLIVQLLYNRGITTQSQLEPFLAGDWRLSADPCLLPDMPVATARIYRALLSGEKIAIYGDFDADGVTSTALLVQGLTALGATVTPYIPHRQTEGYGLTTTALEGLQQQGASLVITVDCGITNFTEVKRARKMGLDIIVTDHHVPLPELPEALAVVDPKLSGSPYPFTDLAGVGVAFKLLQALLRSLGKEEQLAGIMDLVALGTIADMSPLVGENRFLVKEGLKALNANPRLGIRQIAAQAGLSTRQLSAEDVSWVVAPRLNAAGRVAHALTSYNLLMTDSTDEACRLAQWLEEKNAERQEMTALALARAREQVTAQEITPLLVAGDEAYPIGIAGLVASRLVEEFYRPAIVIRVGEKTSSGSCRSIPEFNIVAALGQCSELLSQFGGHSQAAGFSLPTQNLPRFQQQLQEIAATQLTGVELRARLNIDAVVPLSELAGETFRQIQKLAPFGRGNTTPIFLSHCVEVLNRRTMGSNSDHIRLKLRQGGLVWDAVGFGLGEHLAEISPCIDVVYTLEIDRWNGEEKLRLNILDFASAV